MNGESADSKDVESISDFKDFPDIELSMLSVPSFKDLLPNFYNPISDSSMSVFKHFPTDLGLPSFYMEKMIENMKMPQFDADLKFKDDFLNKFHSNSNSTMWTKSESQSRVCSLVKGIILKHQCFSRLHVGPFSKREDKMFL
jgi:hypothetical protein